MTLSMHKHLFSTPINKIISHTNVLLCMKFQMHSVITKCEMLYILTLLVFNTENIYIFQISGLPQMKGMRQSLRE